MRATSRKGPLVYTRLAWIVIPLRCTIYFCIKTHRGRDTLHADASQTPLVSLYRGCSFYNSDRSRRGSFARQTATGRLIINSLGCARRSFPRLCFISPFVKRSAMRIHGLACRIYTPLPQDRAKREREGERERRVLRCHPAAHRGGS